MRREKIEMGENNRRGSGEKERKKKKKRCKGQEEVQIKNIYYKREKKTRRGRD